MKKRITSCIAILYILLSVMSVAWAVGNGDVTVYVTKTGECYHRESCSYLKSSIEITLEEASQMYRPCSRCNPPILGDASSHDTDSYKSGGYSKNYNSNASASKPTTAPDSSGKNGRKFGYGTIISAAGVVVCGCAIKAAVDKEKEKKRLQEEAERFRKDKEEFLLLLSGRNILDVAGVPANIRFVNGYPIDNNDSVFGSFTVYISSRGSCYHQKQGCCSARIRVHAFKLGWQYRPCSKCVSKQITIPEWYNSYKVLRDKCVKFDIPFDEQRER